MKWVATIVLVSNVLFACASSPAEQAPGSAGDARPGDSAGPWDGDPWTGDWTPVPAGYGPLLQSSMSEGEADELRRILPFEWIEMIPPQPSFWPGERFLLRRDGGAMLIGPRGEQSGKVSVFDYGHLCWLLEANRFPQMESRYSVPVTDAGAWIIRVQSEGADGPTEVTCAGGNAPLELWAIGAAIEGVVRRIRWPSPNEADRPR